MRNTQNIEGTLFFALKKKCFIKLINDKRKKVRKEEEIKEERSSSSSVCACQEEEKQQKRWRRELKIIKINFSWG